MAAVRGLMLAAAVVMLTAAKHPPAAAPAADPPPVAAPTIKAGVEKWRAGDYAGAVAIWQPFAAAGDADALFNMGQAYKLGRGVTADAGTARDYYRRAAAKGHLPAQANLGIALFQAGEKPEAIKWLKTAADRGEARAQYVLGIATFNGDGVTRSQSVGYGYLLRAQASGLPQAATALGSITPGLSPADRSAGEAVAASLAAGTGVPAALAAATAPRLIPATPPVRSAATLPIITPPHATASLPVVTPPPPTAVATAGASSAAPPATAAAPLFVPSLRQAVPAPRPTGVAAADLGARPAATPTGIRAAAGPPADRPALPPAPRPTPPTPIREPTPAQADAAAAAPPRPTVATVEIPASRPPVEPLHADTPPVRVARGPDALAPPVRAARGPDALAPPVRTAAAAPSATTPPLKPFQTVDAPVKKADGWRVQLGAFSSRKLADAAWADAKAAAAPAKPLFASDGPVTKLQMGPFPTRDAAKAACTKLTAAGRACFVTQG